MNRAVLAVFAALVVAAVVWGVTREGEWLKNARVPSPPAEQQQEQTPPPPPENVQMPEGVERADVSGSLEEVPPELTPDTVVETQGVQQITGRLVTKNHEPVRDALVRTSIRRGHEYRYADLQTNRDGVFAMNLPLDFDGERRLLSIRTRPTSAYESAWHEGSEVLWPTYPVGLTDIGDIVVTTLPLLCSGTVKNASGVELQGVSVYAMPRSVDIKDMHDKRLPEMFRCDTGTDGTFRIYGKHEQKQYTVVARSPGMIQTENVHFAPGAKRLGLVLASGGILSGSVKLGKNLDPAYVYVDLVGDAVAGHIGDVGEPLLASMRPLSNKSRRRVRVDAAGGFIARNLRAGTLRCSVHVAGRAQPIVDVASVRIDAGRSCVDPRLKDVDLSDIRLTTVTFAKAPGDAAVRPMLVGVKEAGMPQWGQRRVGEDGRMVVAAKGPFSVLAQQCGYRRTMVENIDKDTTIELQRGVKTRIKARLGAPIAAEFGISLQLIGLDAASGAGTAKAGVPRSEVWPITSDEAVTVTVPAPGRYKAEIRVFLKGGSRAQSMATSGLTPAEITIHADREGVEHVFELPETEAFRATQVLNQLFQRGTHYGPK